MFDYKKIIAEELNLNERYVGNAISLIDEGNTIPFIARYRKEMTNSMDDQALRTLGERLTYLRNLDKRKEEVINSIEEQGKMTDELREMIDKSMILSNLEDIYRPYKPKRKTRASIAKEKGLEPLANIIFRQDPKLDIENEAKKYLTNDVKTIEEALNGASDILAEFFSDDTEVRTRLKKLYLKEASLRAINSKDEDSVYQNYYNYLEKLSKVKSHNTLAINRGEKEGFLKVSIDIDQDKAINILKEMFLSKTVSKSQDFVTESIIDSYKRLIAPSIENELRSDLTEDAASKAITVFSDNLRELLLQPPIKGKIAMGLDPGYRMGCKVSVVDKTGKVLDTDVVFPTPEFNRVDEAKVKVKNLIKKYNVEIVAIGNGTASKETEIFLADVIKDFPNVQYMVVSEAGASVYSASPLAAKEFPNYDVNLRSSISIARRLQDPLSELVKIDPKAIGVGQYQHDLPEKKLESALDGVVEYCVNSVGCDLNTASATLLSHISGLNQTISKNIVSLREEKGEFKSRAELKKVKGLGDKAYIQAAGFLRIPNGKVKLDETSVHPESYDAARIILKLTGFAEDDIGKDTIKDLPSRVNLIGIDKIIKEANVGKETIDDIVSELVKPGRDMRDSLPKPLLRSDILSMEDLKIGMELVGTVRNVVDFGAFIDIGVHQDGLVHLSQISNRYLKHPSEALKIGQVIKVKIIDIDLNKKRISLTTKDLGNNF